jgi:hypothetical protein
LIERRLRFGERRRRRCCLGSWDVCELRLGSWGVWCGVVWELDEGKGCDGLKLEVFDVRFSFI